MIEYACEWATDHTYYGGASDSGAGLDGHVMARPWTITENIMRFAKEGWRLHSAVPVTWRERNPNILLIFEREAK